MMTHLRSIVGIHPREPETVEKARRDAQELARRQADANRRLNIVEARARTLVRR